MKFCIENELPIFVPLDGFCFSCGKNIFDYHINDFTNEENGYSVDYAKENFITSCPYCRRSFCD